MSDDRIAGKEGSQGLASLRLWPFSLSHFHLCKQGKAKAAKALVFSTQVHSLTLTLLLSPLPLHRARLLGLAQVVPAAVLLSHSQSDCPAG